MDECAHTHTTYTHTERERKRRTKRQKEKKRELKDRWIGCGKWRERQREMDGVNGESANTERDGWDGCKCGPTDRTQCKCTGTQTKNNAEFR